jgi:hypothetical protein
VESDPQYLFGEKVAHELIHKAVDLNVRGYSVETRIDNSNYMMSERKRAGLMTVNPVFYDNQEPVEFLRNQMHHGERRGQILNELPNYFYENAFLEDFLNSPEGKELYKDELQRREELMQSDPKINENGTAFRREDGSRIILFRDNIHFNNNGEIILNDEVVMHQLADTLYYMIEDIREDTLFTLMLKAKRDPRRQLPVKEAIDNVMGKGFYHRLKTTPMEYSNVENLLVEVENKYYQMIDNSSDGEAHN